MLEPVLFLIYINSLMRMKESQDTICFADNIVIHLTETSWDDIKKHSKRIGGLFFEFKYLRAHLYNIKYLKIYYKALLQSPIR